MSAKKTAKRILPLVVVGAKTNRGAILESASTSMEIAGKRVACVGDKLIDPIDGEVTIMTGLDKLEFRNKPVAGVGSVLSNGSYIVDAGQNMAFWVQFDDGSVTMMMVDGAHAAA